MLQKYTNTQKTFTCNFRENDITSIIDTTFAVEHDSFGQLQVQELKPNGRDIQVTEDNKKEYVRLYVNYRFTRGIEQQFQALHKGFSELVPHHLLNNFDEKELEVSINEMLIFKCHQIFLAKL